MNKLVDLKLVTLSEMTLTRSHVGLRFSFVFLCLFLYVAGGPCEERRVPFARDVRFCLRGSHLREGGSGGRGRAQSSSGTFAVVSVAPATDRGGTGPSLRGGTSGPDAQVAWCSQEGRPPPEGAFLTRCPSTPRFRPFPAFVANSDGDASRRDPRPRCLFYYFPPFVQKTYTTLSYLHSGSFKGIQHGARKMTGPSRALLFLVLEEKLSFAEFRLTFLRACASGERAGNSFLPEPADPEGSARGRGVCGPQDLERAVGRDKKAAR